MSLCNVIIGAYTASVGVTEFRKDIARFIEERDGYSADYRNIFLTNGASDGIRVCLSVCSSVLLTCIVHLCLYSSLCVCNKYYPNIVTNGFFIAQGLK